MRFCVVFLVVEEGREVVLDLGRLMIGFSSEGGADRFQGGMEGEEGKEGGQGGFEGRRVQELVPP